MLVKKTSLNNYLLPLLRLHHFDGQGVTPLEVQLQQFQELIHYKHLHRDQISKSIFFLEAGSNDIFTYLQAPEKSTLSPIAFVDSMLREAANFLDIIYQHGARKIAIFSVGPMGCIPGRINLPNASTHRCYAGANKMTKYYNYGLERLVYSIRRKYRGAIGVYGEVFNTAQRLRVRPKLHGIPIFLNMIRLIILFVTKF